MLALYVWIRNWLEAQDGQDLVEYALLLGLIALAAVIAVATVGGGVKGIWTTLVTVVNGAAGMIPAST